jgi:hypothetical protein
LQTADVAGGKVEQARGFGLGAVAAPEAVQDFEEIAFPLAHGNPVWDTVDRHGSSLA